MANSCLLENETNIKEIKGLITSIQDYSVHDGYGIRMLVFLKGCPLRCKWCQNPEAVKSGIEIEYHSSLCTRCGECFKVCPEGAIIDPQKSEDKTKRIDRQKCTKCGLCVKACRWGTLSSVGQWMTVEQILKKVERIIPFFKDSGGITISGGDPVFQPKFSAALLKSCREMGIHTAIETSGFTTYDIFKCLADYCDLVLYDIKHMDNKKHIWGIGQSNKLIHENLTRFVKESDIECVVRVPLIPGYNDDIENIRKTAKFLSSLRRPPKLDLLPFNVFAGSKYKIIGLEVEYQYSNAKRQTEDHLNKLVEAAKSYGLDVITEGLW
jgi:pyruvate formate lyase activating enzyme